jgi:hypothetical protein
MWSAARLRSPTALASSGEALKLRSPHTFHQGAAQQVNLHMTSARGVAVPTRACVRSFRRPVPPARRCARGERQGCCRPDEGVRAAVQGPVPPALCSRERSRERAIARCGRLREGAASRFRRAPAAQNCLKPPAERGVQALMQPLQDVVDCSMLYDYTPCCIYALCGSASPMHVGSSHGVHATLSGNLQFTLDVQQMKQGGAALLRCGIAQLLHHSDLAPAAQTVAAAKCTCNQTLTLLTLALAPSGARSAASVACPSGFVRPWKVALSGDREVCARMRLTPARCDR